MNNIFVCFSAATMNVWPHIPWYVNALIASVFLAHPFVMAIKNKKNKK